MTGAQILLALCVGLSLLALTVRLTAKRLISERITLLWLFLCWMLIAVACYPDLLTQIATWFGFLVPANAVFAFSILAIILFNYYVTVRLSVTDQRIRRLTQEMAIARMVSRDPPPSPPEQPPITAVNESPPTQANPTPAMHRGTPWAPLLALFAGTIIIRFALSLGIPGWGWDERGYLNIARGLYEHGTQRVLHNALYPLLISPAFAWRENFLFVVRLINGVLAASALFPIYAVAQYYVSRRAALLVAGFAVLLAQNFIAAFVMTESLIFPLLWWCVYFLVVSLRFALLFNAPVSNARRHAYAIGLGVSLAMLHHATPKGRPLFVAFVMTILLFSVWRGPKRLLGMVTVATVSALLVALGLNGLIMRELWPSFAGFYRDAVQPISIANFVHIVTTQTEYVVDLLIGHWAMTGVWLGLFLVIGLLGAARSFKERDVEKLTLTVPVVLLVLGFYAQNLIYTVCVGDIITTMFARYHYFVYPGIFLLGALYWRQLTLNNRERVILLTLVASILCAAYYTFYGPSHVSLFGGLESAELWPVRWRPAYVIVMVLLALTSGLYVLLPKQRHLSWGIAVLALFVHGIASNVAMARNLDFGKGDGRTACYYLSRAMVTQNDTVALFSDDRLVAERTQLWYPFNIYGDVVARDRVVRDAEVPPEVKFILTEGQVAVALSDVEVIGKTDECTLMRRKN